jgi:hypothetical protein
MTEFFAWEYEQQRIEFESLREHCNHLSAENYRVAIHLHLIQDWLDDLERRAEKLADTFRTKAH